jgi:hypothetical protein
VIIDLLGDWAWQVFVWCHNRDTEKILTVLNLFSSTSFRGAILFSSCKGGFCALSAAEGALLRPLQHQEMEYHFVLVLERAEHRHKLP